MSKSRAKNITLKPIFLRSMCSRSPILDWSRREYDNKQRHQHQQQDSLSSLFTDSAPETATQSEGNYWDWQFYRTYRLEEEPNMLITKMPSSIQPTTVGVHARVKHQRQTQVLRCLCRVGREVTLVVAAVCWDHVCHMMCRVLLSCCGQPGDTNGSLSWEELKASTPCCSAEQSIIACTWQVFFKHQEWARTWNWECFLLWLNAI